MKADDEKIIDFGFWKKVKENAAAEKRPIFVMAPLADVTDAAFRRIIARYSRMGKPGGGPDALWTEFVSADGLCSAGREVLVRDLAFTEAERPIVAQLFTSNSEKMRQAAELVVKLGFDGLDINMGCPDRSIEKQGAGACMMKDPEKAIAVIKAAREGVAVQDIATFSGPARGSRSTVKACVQSPRTVESSVSFAAPIPVSVKTRIGYNKVEIDTWIRALLEQKLPVLTVHLRTRKEMSEVPAHWELMPEIIKLRDDISPETLIIGNGDVASLADAKEKTKKSGCDGVMFGRAIFGNPWLFDRERELETQTAVGRDGQKSFSDRASATEEKELVPGGKAHLAGDKNDFIRERLRVMLEHTELYEKLLGDVKSFAIMKKHYKAYVNGWPAQAGRDGAKELRMKLMEAKDAAEVREIVENYLK